MRERERRARELAAAATKHECWQKIRNEKLQYKRKEIKQKKNRKITHNKPFIHSVRCVALSGGREGTE